jgi:hypothetical protein
MFPHAEVLCQSLKSKLLVVGIGGPLNAHSFYRSLRFHHFNLLLKTFLQLHLLSIPVFPVAFTTFICTRLC